ncbi:MAG: hypothetical protein CL897_06820 [Dehalococcoidia bacterium]|nr:hypothetical protein [Dehalococcoidia bacterium]|tara:strand:+ start:3491 stop:4279 length:789 start_codon:yes stop_codon:yes gene_type:complete
MTTAEQTWTESTTEVAGLTVRYLQGGSGPAAVVLHHSSGNIGWAPFYEALSQKFTVIVPDLPGYGQSERPVWARDARDIAILVNRFLAQVAPEETTLIGLGFGGFIAAELATMDQERLSSLVLVGAAGVQPEEGELLDQMLIDYPEYISAGFRDEAHYHEIFGEEITKEVRELWEFSREMTARLSWKPYMFNRRLPHLLSEVETSTLVISGSEEKVIPITCARQYTAGLPNATLKIIEGAGHYVAYEEPEELASLIAGHAGI